MGGAASSEAFKVGQKLVELCKAGKNLEAVDTLYAADAVSVEAAEHPGMPARREGLKSIREKNQWWLDNHEVHGGSTRGPFPHGDRFAVLFDYDVTPKVGPMAGKRMKMEEVALYTVQGGKVTKEEFFYHMG